MYRKLLLILKRKPDALSRDRSIIFSRGFILKKRQLYPMTEEECQVKIVDFLNYNVAREAFFCNTFSTFYLEIELLWCLFLKNR